MKLIITSYGYEIHPTTPMDVVFIEQLLGLENNGDAMLVRRSDGYQGKTKNLNKKLILQGNKNSTLKGLVDEIELEITNIDGLEGINSPGDELITNKIFENKIATIIGKEIINKKLVKFTLGLDKLTCKLKLFNVNKSSYEI